VKTGFCRIRLAFGILSLITLLDLPKHNIRGFLFNLFLWREQPITHFLKQHYLYQVEKVKKCMGGCLTSAFSSTKFIWLRIFFRNDKAWKSCNEWLVPVLLSLHFNNYTYLRNFKHLKQKVIWLQVGIILLFTFALHNLCSNKSFYLKNVAQLEVWSGVITTKPTGQPCWQHSHRRGDSQQVPTTIFPNDATFA